MSDHLEIDVDASPAVRSALERVGRTEDLRFSPSNARLAITGFAHDSIAIVGVDISAPGERPQVRVTDVTELSSPVLHAPHGVDFLDEDTIVVANRDGSVVVLGLPTGDPGADPPALSVVELPPDRGFELLSAPGSLAITPGAGDAVEVLICNNDGDSVTMHTLRRDPVAVTSNEVLLRRSLDLPDSVTVSGDGRWLAVSNHTPHVVMVYERSVLGEHSEPACILRGALFPHGLRFTADARHLVVADAGRPYVHVFARDGETWRGVHYPVFSLRVMDDDTFERGRRRNRHEGGPKGIDLDRDGRVLALTAEQRPLAFFDLAAIVERSTGQFRDDAASLRYELEVMERAHVAKERIATLEGSASFRITEPLRRLHAPWARRRR